MTHNWIEVIKSGVHLPKPAVFLAGAVQKIWDLLTESELACLWGCRGCHGGHGGALSDPHVPPILRGNEEKKKKYSKSSMLKRARLGQKQQVFLWRISIPMFPTPEDFSSGQEQWKYPRTVPQVRSIGKGIFATSYPYLPQACPSLP